MHTAKKILLSTLLAASVFAWCAHASKPQVDGLRVYALDCGRIHFENFGGFSDTGEYDGESRDLADPCILVGHPKGWLLWDTGLAKSTKEKPFDTFGAHFTLAKTIQEQLAEIGLTPGDINYISFSHFHFDHTGNANDFPKSTWILQEKELNYGISQPTPEGVVPKAFSGYSTAKKILIHGDHDVFGDGSVRFFALPGHTPGHQALMVKLPTQNYVFSGDLYHQEESREHGYVPTFNYNRADTLASMDRLEKLIKNNHAKLIVQHDKDDFESLPKFPQALK